MKYATPTLGQETDHQLFKDNPELKEAKLGFINWGDV